MLNQTDQLRSKTAGYHRHILRLPILVKVLFKRKRFFAKYCFFIIFSNFSNFKHFLIFSLKKLTNKLERHCQEIMPCDTHSTKKLPHLAFLKKFKVYFLRNPSIFPKRNKILNVLKNFTVSGIVYGKFATSW